MPNIGDYYKSSAGRIVEITGVDSEGVTYRGVSFPMIGISTIRTFLESYTPIDHPNKYLEALLNIEALLPTTKYPFDKIKEILDSVLPKP